MHQLAYRRQENGDIQGKRQQIHKIQLSPHNQKTSEADHSNLHHANGCLNPCIEKTHGTVVAHFGFLEGVIGAVKFLVLRFFRRKGFGSADAGDSAFNCRIDLSGFDFDFSVGLLHFHPLPHGKSDTGRKKHQQYGCQPCVDGKENDHRSDQCNTAGQKILRAVMSQFHNFEKVVGYPCHQYASSVFVKEGKRERLDMREYIPAHVRFHQRSHPVPDNGNQILKPCTQQIADKQRRHNDKEHHELLFRQERIHGVPCQIGESEIHQRHEKREQHIQQKCRLMRSDIGGKYGEFAFFVVDRSHLSLTYPALKRERNSFVLS